MNNYIEYFTNYVFKNYDMSNPLISLKYYHSIRVARIMAMIAKKLNLSEEDIILAFKLGLCHDLGRFYEVVRCGKFNNLGFDHGTYSNKVLYNDGFINYMDVPNHLLFRKAIYNHNKKDITKDLDSKEEFFTKLLRDIDKLDILGMMATHRVFDFIDEPNEVILDSFMKNMTISVRDIHNQSDLTVFYLSFFKSLNFDINKDMAINHGCLDNFISIINVNPERKNLFDDIVGSIYEERGKVYVR